MDDARQRLRIAPQGWVGLFLLAVCWPLNWTLPGVRTACLFFPLWLGCILVMDAPASWRADTSLEYYALCTLSFSTVMPAVFETAELVWTFRWVKSVRSGSRVSDTSRVDIGLLFAGLIMLALTLAWLQHGDWRPVISLSLDALICGVFGKIWNFRSWPQWIFHTPGANFLHVFEMPLPGYGGYVPFGLELFGLKNLLWACGPMIEF
jgi:hypothetical protein